ncbi:MAG: M20/M25/M40 family metallo-hydrolase [Gemmatimonadota bacterium]|nr:M20/M25/M40 family metallo-hydrolase [Gemmatimonadota bacterium]
MKKTVLALATLALVGSHAELRAQTFPTDDPVIREMWEQGMGDGSQIFELAQALLDSIGPRLMGSPAYERSGDWLLERYAEWGVDADKQVYGTWRGWERGPSHIDLISPRVRSLSGMMLAWSPDSDGPVEADVVVLPMVTSAAEFEAWLPGVDGKAVAVSFAEPTCRAPESWEEFATAEAYEQMRADRSRAAAAWNESRRAIGAGLEARLEEAGAVAVLTGNWSQGWGADKIFAASTTEIPSMHLSCEDYGLVARLAENDQSPRVRIDVESEFLGDVPAFNVVGVIPGTQLPNEYVLLSAHLDSWDGASGATDNGTGTLMMLEAMRILKAAYPSPRRTIMVGHWGGEEQGLIGSTAFAADNPEVIDGLQAAFNQDNGTWRVDYVRMMGFTGAGAHFARWFSAIPNEITDHIELDIPGMPERGGSDHMSFICAPAPGFRLQSNYPDYRQYTWHTNLDTFDKIVFADLRNNATLAAMLAYQASEDPERMPRDTRVLPSGPPSDPTEPSRRTMASSAFGEWPTCRPPRRSFGGN